MEEEKYSVHIDDRKHLWLNGVEEVISFTTEEAYLITKNGPLQITGSDFHLDQFDMSSKQITITGTIDSLYYPSGNEKEKKGLLGRFLS